MYEKLKMFQRNEEKNKRYSGPSKRRQNNTKKSNVLLHYLYVVKIVCPPLLFNYTSNQQLLSIAMALNNSLDETTYIALINR